MDSWGIETQYIVPYFPAQRKGFPVPFCRISMTFGQKITLCEEIHNLLATAEIPLNKGFFTVSTDFSTAVMLTPFSPNCSPFRPLFAGVLKDFHPCKKTQKRRPEGRLFSILADLPMALLVSGDALTNQNQNLTIQTPTLIIGNDMELIQHFFVNADRHTFDGHKITPKQLYFMFILCPPCDIVFYMDIKHI